MPRVKAPPVKRQRIDEVQEEALLAAAEQVVEQLEHSEIERWQACVDTPSRHIDFAAVPEAAIRSFVK